VVREHHDPKRLLRPGTSEVPSGGGELRLGDVFGPQRRVGYGERLLEGQARGTVEDGADRGGDARRPLSGLQVTPPRMDPGPIGLEEVTLPRDGDPGQVGLVRDGSAVRDGGTEVGKDSDEAMHLPSVLGGGGEGIPAAPGAVDDVGVTGPADARAEDSGTRAAQVAHPPRRPSASSTC